MRGSIVTCGHHRTYIICHNTVFKLCIFISCLPHYTRAMVLSINSVYVFLELALYSHSLYSIQIYVATSTCCEVADVCTACMSGSLREQV